MEKCGLIMIQVKLIIFQCVLKMKKCGRIIESCGRIIRGCGRIIFETFKSGQKVWAHNDFGQKVWAHNSRLNSVKSQIILKLFECLELFEILHC